MSYIALARKWRPRTFSQLVGQDHINKALINSLNQQRVHHAYLFTGTRGVGKTSIARLLAKALNCESGISHEPCLQCEACLAIEQGRFFDLIEVDGASRTRVEDTRDILENVQYAPTHGRFKIYLIDEVHMLSQHSFNALLKTLEEPPAHVKFLLATTDPQKIPVTVLSRCLQFNLKPLSAHLICQSLQEILKNESLTFELPALELLANAAKGSMRDALSLLDQAIASSRDLTVHDIKQILGYTREDYALQLLHALVALDPQKLITISRQIATEGGNFHYVLDEMLNYFHQITVCQQLPEHNLLIAPGAEVLNLSTLFTPEDAQLFYQIGVKGREEIHLAPTLAIGFEMTLLRMYTFKPAKKIAPPPLAYQHPVQAIATNAAIQQAPAQTESNLAPPTPIPAPTPLAPSPIKNTEEKEWVKLLPQLKLTGLALNAAENAEFVVKNEGKVELRIMKGHQSVFTAAVIGRIEQALTQFYHEPIKLTFSSNEPVLTSPAQQKEAMQQKATENAHLLLANDPFFQQLKEEFSAEVIKNSVTLLQDDL